jgi:hypothetical protein
MATQLKNSSGEYVTVNDGESCNFSGTLKDTAGTTVSTISSLKLTLLDETTGAIINSRDNQDVNGANGGTFSAGVFTVEFDGDDTAAVGEIADGKSQNRIARMAWEYSDGDTTRKGIQEFLFPVYKMKTTTGAGTGSVGITLTQTDSSGNPVPEASLWVTTDLAGQNIVAGPVITTVSGITPTLNLNPGTYYSWSSHTDYTFTNPSKFTVTS